MDYKFETLDWDSAFLGFSVQNLTITGHQTELCSSVLGRIKSTLCYVQTDVPLENTSVFSYAGSKVIFEKHMKGIHNNENNHIVPVDEKFYNKHLDKLKSLAYLSGTFSRFNLDKKFEPHVFNSLYDHWLLAAVKKQFDNLFFVYLDEFELPIGLLTAKLDLINKIGKVGLLAVDEESQGKGIGSSLLTFLEQLCNQNGIAILQIPTQLENPNSCKFYNKMGYKSVEVKHIYHYWS